jgi:hypothetical protein
MMMRRATTTIMRRTFTSSSNNKTMQTAMHQQQCCNRHFLIVQWPTNDVTIRLDESRTVREQQEMLNDIATYAESQTQRLYNLQPLDAKRQSLEFIAQQSRLLDSMLNDKDSDKTLFLSPNHNSASVVVEPNTLSCQLNNITLIDRSPIDDSNHQISKALKAQENKKMMTKKKASKTKEAPATATAEELVEEEEHPVVASKN